MPQFFQKIARNEVQKSKSKEEIQIIKKLACLNFKQLQHGHKSRPANLCFHWFLNLDFLF